MLYHRKFGPMTIAPIDLPKTSKRVKFYGEGEQSPPVPTPPAPTNEKRFTESDVKLFVSRETEKYKNELSAMEAKLTELASGVVAPEVRAALESQIAELQTKTKTTAELAKQNEAKLRAEADKKAKELTDGMQLWKDRFTSTKIENDLVVALGGSCTNPADFVSFLGRGAYVDDDLNTRVKLKGVDGKDLDMSAAETVEYMKGQPKRYGYWFASETKGGVGHQGAKPGGNAGDLNNEEVLMGIVKEVAKGK